MTVEWEDRDPGGPADEYWWAGGENPHDLHDSGAYQEHAEDAAYQEMAVAFDEYCTDKGAFDQVTASSVDYFTSLFLTALRAEVRDPGVSKVYRADFESTVQSFIRANREEDKAHMLLFSHARKHSESEFYLPTGVARNLSETILAQSGGRPVHGYGQIVMSHIERFHAENSHAGAGYLVEMDITADTVIKPMLFVPGKAASLALHHIQELAETIPAERSKTGKPYVMQIEASTLLALALSEVAEQQHVILGLTGVQLERLPGTLHVGVMVVDIPDLSESVLKGETQLNPGTQGLDLSTSLLPSFDFTEREIGFRFTISEPFPGVFCSNLKDMDGRRFLSA